MAQLRSVTCHIGSHSVTCYPTQVNTPRLNPIHAGRYSIYLPRRDGRLSWPSWLDSALAGVEPATFRSRVQRSTNATTKTVSADLPEVRLPVDNPWMTVIIAMLQTRTDNEIILILTSDYVVRPIDSTKGWTEFLHKNENAEVVASCFSVSWRLHC